MATQTATLKATIVQAINTTPSVFMETFEGHVRTLL